MTMLMVENANRDAGRGGTPSLAEREPPTARSRKLKALRVGRGVLTTPDSARVWLECCPVSGETQPRAAMLAPQWEIRHE